MNTLAMDGERFNSALLAKLGQTDGPAAERALCHALQAGTGVLQQRVLIELLRRPGEGVRIEVASMLGLLDIAARRALIDQPDLLEPLARVGLRAQDPAVRIGIIDLLSRTHHPSCAYLLAEGVSDALPKVRKQAATALLRLTREHLADRRAVTTHILPAVTTAVRAARRHRCGEAIQAAVLLGFRCSHDVLDLLDRPDSRLTGPLMTALRDLPAEEAADFLFSALRYRNLRKVARSYIAHADWPTLAAIGRRSHWLALRPIREALDDVQHVQAAADDPHGLVELPSGSQAGALRVAMACGLSPRVKQTLLTTALAGEAASAGAAMPYVLGWDGDATELILMALHSRHEEVQTAAGAKIIATGISAKLTEHLLASLGQLDGPVRSVMSHFLAAESFRRYWRSYKRLDPTLRRRAGSALLKLDGSVADLLGARLVGRDTAHRLQATQMVNQLDMAERFIGPLCHLARHADRRVRSAAAATLGSVDDYEVRRTLARCLHDTDARVQANAVDSLGRVGGDPTAVLDKLDSENCRLRANVIKWLLEAQHPRGPLALATMLTDSRPAHRTSALWVARTLRYAPAADLLNRLATGDPDPKVRARAGTALAELQEAATQEATTQEAVT